MSPRAVRPLALVAMVGGALYVVLGAVVSLATGGLTLGVLYFAGVCLLLVGLALLPVATYRAAILPDWSAYLVGALAAIIFGGFGTVVVGLAWIAPAYVLWSGRDTRARTVR